MLALDNPYTAAARATVVVPSRNTLRFEALGYTAGGGPSATGFRSARLTDADPGLKHQIVALTDREITRTLLDYYGSAKAMDQALEFNMVTAGLLTVVDGTQDISSLTNVKITHGLTKPADPTDLTDTANLDAEANVKATFQGSVHDVAGTFHCGLNCMVTVDGTFYQSDDAVVANRGKLATLNVSVPDTNVLYFKPASSSAPVYLGPSGITGASVVGTDDNAYMLFGYWLDEPSSVEAPHSVGVFCKRRRH